MNSDLPAKLLLDDVPSLAFTTPSHFSSVLVFPFPFLLINTKDINPFYLCYCLYTYFFYNRINLFILLVIIMETNPPSRKG